MSIWARKVMSSRQMKEVEIALEVDAAATSELNVEVETSFEFINMHAHKKYLNSLSIYLLMQYD
jgi:hypothetical protein